MVSSRVLFHVFQFSTILINQKISQKLMTLITALHTFLTISIITFYCHQLLLDQRMHPTQPAEDAAREQNLNHGNQNNQDHIDDEEEDDDYGSNTDSNGSDAFLKFIQTEYLGSNYF